MRWIPTDLHARDSARTLKQSGGDLRKCDLLLICPTARFRNIRLTHMSADFFRGNFRAALMRSTAALLKFCALRVCHGEADIESHCAQDDANNYD